jgi:hypothetical protein
MNNTDKAMELADALHWIDDFIARCNGDDRGSCESVNIVRDHIEAMQKEAIINNRDCRTCDYCYYDDAEPEGIGCEFRGGNTVCTNHDQWKPFEFKQLTKEQK